MVALLEDNRTAIAELCERYGVVRIDVFGSVLRDDFHPGESDIDLLAEFAPRDPYQLAKDYFDLLDELERLVGVKVDLVMVGAVKNPYVAEDVEQTKQLLYAA
jgi:uncharacterized protein